MASTRSESCSSMNNSSSISIEEELLLDKIALTHNPDGRRLDAGLLLRVMEIVMSFANSSSSQVSDVPENDLTSIPSIEVFGSEESLGHTIYAISSMMHRECCGEEEAHVKTMELLETLGHYRWDAKVAIILAAFATGYGKFRLVLLLQGQNPLAALIALLKHLPYENMITSNPRFKAMALLVDEMVSSVKCIVKFENFPLQHLLLDDDIKSVTKTQIYLATYWIFRSSLACSSQITGYKHETPNTKVNVAWGLSSLVVRLSRLNGILGWLLHECEKQIEQRIHRKLLDLLTDRTQPNNQEVLNMLFSLNDDLPLKDCSSQMKVGVSELQNKVVVLLISRPTLFPVEKTLFLLQRTRDHPDHKKIEQSYRIVWVPISSSNKWTLDEEMSFEYLSSSLPWLSIRQPWLLNPAVVSFIEKEWNFLEEPLMVVLDSQGMVSHSNAIDMVLIWGANKAFPFSSTREKELWEVENNWSLPFMVDGLDPFLMQMVEEGRNVCLCGSEDIEWVRQFCSRVKEMKNAGLQLELFYVGKRGSSKNMEKITTIIEEARALTLVKIQFFWLRLESMKRSILRLGQAVANYGCYFFLNEISNLLDTDDNWAVFASWNSGNILKLEGKKIMECFDKFPVWGDTVEKLGLVDAMRNGSESFTVIHDTPCNHSKILAFDEGANKASIVCERCKRRMDKFVVYECRVAE